MMQKLNDEKEFPEGHLLAGDFFFFRVREFDHAQQQYEAGHEGVSQGQGGLSEAHGGAVRRPAGEKPGSQRVCWRTVLKENPKDNDAIAMRAALMLTTGNRDQINMAANDLQALVTKTPQESSAALQPGAGAGRQGRHRCGAAATGRSHQDPARFHRGARMLARIYLAKGDSAKALKAADEIIALDHNNLRGAPDAVERAAGHGRRDKAREELEFITKTYPRKSGGHAIRSACLAYAGQGLSSRPSRFSPSCTRPIRRTIAGWRALTEALAGEGRMDEAIKEVQKAERQGAAAAAI